MVLDGHFLVILILLLIHDPETYTINILNEKPARDTYGIV